ncbi:aldose epimerase family protein [Halalkalibacter akibai]|uniref:Aldose 1-epimerase n=1 Tax=Halalkalibacter akibai (strain ATCC 43226 / DSM 21942 / CIP 109018 / JCM 9157 / 1139) TaxID=1236973 RepID=W4QT51_HALA3|nr:aldose epimerase family protein [Halalkalibacter akibai]GAE34813.1 aldose 1-epimerase [Halalkalibacter akibai JCM 9157]
MNITKENFGELNGDTVTAYRLINDHGMQVSCIDYGCTITEINVPDQTGNIENVVLGFDTVEEYKNHSPFFGCIVGRVAGRIGQAEFDLDGKNYKLLKNDGDNHLHGGLHGFDKVIWDATVEETADEVKLIFTHVSPDGDEGYPGNVNLTVTYSLNNNNTFQISYEATTDQKTLLNLTNHSYFNLSGNLKTDILDHELTLKSDQFVELSDALIPTGHLLDVEATAFDFRLGRKIKDGVTSEHPQNKLVGGGYDHPLLLSANHQEEISLIDFSNGRKLVIETDEPAVVLYTSNMMGDNFNIRGVQARKYLGVCLETQHHPDAINHPEFPTIVLAPGEVYQTKTSYSFSVLKGE